MEANLNAAEIEHLRSRIRSLEAGLENFRLSLDVARAASADTHERLREWAARVAALQKENDEVRALQAALQVEVALAKTDRAAFVAEIDRLKLEYAALSAIKLNLDQTISNMQASKFWRLRNAWFRLRGSGNG